MMSFIDKIKKALGKEPVISRDEAVRLRTLPGDQARTEFGALLYETCVKRAGNFVNMELKRGDSPYRDGLSAAVFFHEVLAVTFWLMDKEITGGKKSLSAELHNNYFKHYKRHDEPAENRHSVLMRKYQGYENTWNDITGHLDEFGLCVVQNLYGKDENSRTRERTFWIIQYADETVHACSPLRKVSKTISH